MESGDSIEKLINGYYGLDALVISKTLASYYKDPDRIAHKVLANRIAERDPGNKPQVNDRIPFIYINIDNETKSTLQGDKIETPEFVKQENLEPNYNHYITNQIQKPVCQIYGLCLEQIPGYKSNTDFELQKNKYIKSGKDEYDSNKKIIELRQKLAFDLLFSDHVRILKNKKNGNREITKWFNVQSNVQNNVQSNVSNNDDITYESDSDQEF